MNEELKNFVIRQAAVLEDEVTMEASLENDLGVYGDDAFDFIIAFGKAFNVDVSKFMAADYFNSGGRSWLLGNLQKRKELTVAHLDKAIAAGRLDEEVINS